MTDTPESEPASSHNETYRLCSACGVLIRRNDTFCPECGAETGAEDPPETGRTLENNAFNFLVILILLGTLALLSQNRGTAIENESRRLRVLAPINPADLPPPEIDTAEPDPFATEPVAAEPTFPEPTPGPQPLQQPTPRPQPGNTPNPFGEPDGEPDPFGQPDPPETLEPPEPTPAPPTRAERIQQRRAELMEEYTRVLDENHPMYRPGQQITLRLNDGTTQTGILQQLAGGQVQLRLPTGEARWFFSRQLTPETRVRVDPSERQAIVQERAWTEALREMQGTP